MAGEDRRRLASYVVSRRHKLGFADRAAFAAASGLSVRTIGTLEKGSVVSASTLAKAADTLGWSPDSPDLIMRGGEPVIPGSPASPQSASERFAAWVATQIAQAGHSIRDAQRFLGDEGLPGREASSLPVDFYRKLAAITGRSAAEIMVDAGAVSPDEMAIRRRDERRA